MQIIGLTGSFGSGCSYIAKDMLCSDKYRAAGKQRYKFCSLTQFLKDAYATETGKDPNKATRWELQDFGDDQRKQHERNGEYPYFAELAAQTVDKADGNAPWVIDSIRNPDEIHFLRTKYSGDFYLFAVYADREQRWKRVHKKFDNDRVAFELADERDTGDESPPWGQRVGDCFLEADAVVSNEKDFDAPANDEFQELEAKLDTLLDRVQKALQALKADKDESLMAMAYAAGQRSSCTKRKVGAVIVDPVENVVSSGFNAVPLDEQTCASKYTKCYREHYREDLLSALSEKISLSDEHVKEVTPLLKEKVKALDVCRSVHAEENAILGLSRNGRAVSLEECTLYTTTFPCRLCAKMIVTVKMKQVVYLEPYPDPAAKDILKNGGVPTKFFEGITYRAYFRIYGEER